MLDKSPLLDPGRDPFQQHRGRKRGHSDLTKKPRGSLGLEAPNSNFPTGAPGQMGSGR